MNGSSAWELSRAHATLRYDIYAQSAGCVSIRGQLILLTLADGSTASSAAGGRPSGGRVVVVLAFRNKKARDPGETLVSVVVDSSHNVDSL